MEDEDIAEIIKCESVDLELMNKRNDIDLCLKTLASLRIPLTIKIFYGKF